MNRQDSRGRLAIIAGSGQLPHYVASAAAASGDEPFIILLENEASGDWSGFPSKQLGVGNLAGLKAVFKQHGIRRVIMSGGVSRRPVFAQIKPSFTSFLKLPSILRNLMAGGDSSVLTMVIRLIEAEGVKVIGVQDILPGLLAKTGPLGKYKPSANALTDINVAIHAARLLGSLDIGQGAVAVGGRIIALEGPEGTDAMLGRVADLRQSGKISQKHGGVLVKLFKSGQDLRVDLPSVGLSTLANAKAAGLAGVVMEAGLSLLLEEDRVRQFADDNGMFLLGLDLTAGDMRGSKT